METIRKDPAKSMEVFLMRLQNQLTDIKAEKANHINEWKQVCEQNFLKSLDHRSFVFKDAQKKHLQGKKQFEELKRIALTPLFLKSERQLKGGSSKDHEFFCTYSSFLLNNIQVYPLDIASSKQVLLDAPINMCDSEALMSKRQLLPHMRFIMHDEDVLKLTISLLFAGIRVGSNSSSDKQKME